MISKNVFRPAKVDKPRSTSLWNINAEVIIFYRQQEVITKSFLIWIQKIFNAIEKEIVVTRIFGPVPSRRLGRSLGIDVIPHKTCTFDCIYCECGKTTDKRCRREEFYPLRELLDELDNHLGKMSEKPDVITLSGAGEPTLYSRMGELIIESKKLIDIPVAVITNSSLMDNKDVQEELMPADILLPSLDSALKESFQFINRPHPGCDLKKIIDGLHTVLSKFQGKVYLEVLFLEGINTDRKNLLALASVIETLDFDTIQLNTAVRPGTEKDAHPLDISKLEDIRQFFGPKAEIIAAPKVQSGKTETDAEKKILSLIQRRPCTVEDINRSLGIPVPGIVKIIYSLLDEDRIVKEEHGKDIFYTAAARDKN